MSFWDGLLRSLGRIASDVLRQQVQQRTSGSRGQRTTPVPSTNYPGDYEGRPQVEYSPNTGRTGDPGEVVWCWVPFEEDHTQGKDRPVLLIGRDGAWLLGLPLTSKDHDRDEAQEARAGRRWMDIGTGPWDRRQRPSEVRLDRIVRVDPATVRRADATLDESLFNQVTAAVLARR